MPSRWDSATRRWRRRVFHYPPPTLMSRNFRLPCAIELQPLSLTPLKMRKVEPRTWRKAQLLVMGAILSPGKRTVSSALNILGIGQHGDFAVYHHVLNRAQWSPLQLSRALLLLVAGRLGSSTEPLVFGIDETVERRWGRKIAAKGRYRDPVRSKDDQVVMTPGLQWVSLTLLTRIGWAGRHWALPFLTALVVSARYDRRKGRRHQTVTDYAQQMLVCRRRWLPERDLVVVADGGYAKREFLRHCQSMSKPIVVVTKLRKDASLYQPARHRHRHEGTSNRAGGLLLLTLSTVNCLACGRAGSLIGRRVVLQTTRNGTDTRPALHAPPIPTSARRQAISPTPLRQFQHGDRTSAECGGLGISRMPELRIWRF